mmetsp:Transcript_14175/g.19671  ORF Transcript_14175/g.19671 Transcript_14175/m.19671 type:complete len:291 (+) Transcript_14175:223-1095(+)|eukprot:CAMPEP_0184478948 /NCGR_PEP_ID=MMETSP0113_2-20130426/829_1 /TAXON_ID=91329 /ORGANISM="Norrisiella sphaerica, Strain BC52" /LENGTH=290 /DNA_ID=CAMNT_0026856897 /DNA_START=172 /DNA_END=1044 /DNA_ORIENTATION=+
MSKKKGGIVHFASGAVGGACEILTTMPLDVAKTNMQAYPGKFKNPIHCMSMIVKEKGAFGLYSGLAPFLVQTSGKAAIRFTAFEKCKDALEYSGLDKSMNTTMKNLSSGLMAGVAEASFWTTPTERLKVIRQTNPEMATLGFSQLIQSQGVSGMFVGLLPTALRQASSVGFRFMCYGPIKDVVKRVLGTNPNEKEGTLPRLLAGGTAGAASVVINNPVDVIKSMAQSGKYSNTGFVHLGTQIFKNSGVAGFYAGLSARVPRVFCGQAVTFAVYEKVVVIFGDIEKQMIGK